MKNKVIRLVCAMENSAEKEYIKEFFNFIGCFFFDKKFNLRNQFDWFRFLKIGNGKYDVEIFVNYFGDDPYLQESKHRGTKRIYCYFSLEEGYVKVMEQPLSSLKELQINKNINKKALRQTALNELIGLIWKNEPDIEKAILNIADLYVDNPCVDLFYFLQLKHNFDFLSTAEAKKVFPSDLPVISLQPYLINAIKAVYFVFISLESYKDPYSQYARINAANMLYTLYQKIDPNERGLLQEISFPFLKPFYLVEPNNIISMLKELIEDSPNFLTAYLLMALIYNDKLNDRKNTENCYLKVLTSIPKEQKDYAFIRYQCGQFFEKYNDIDTAIKFYNTTFKLSPTYYPVLLKLAYFLVSKRKNEDAEIYLNQAVDTIFCGKSSERQEDGSWKHWEHLSLEELLYILRMYNLLSAFAIRTNKDHSGGAFVSKMCLATDFFEQAKLVQQISNLDEYNSFISYHSFSEPVWTAWHILKSWGEVVVNDENVTNTIRERTLRYPPKFYGK